MTAKLDSLTKEIHKLSKKVSKDLPFHATGIEKQLQEALAFEFRKSKKPIDLIGNPIKFSLSKVKYKKSPPTLGQDTEKILINFLKLSKKEVDRLKDKKII